MNLELLGFPSKGVGDKFYSSELNEIRTKVNAIVNHLNGLQTIPVVTTPTPVTNAIPSVSVTVSSTSITAGQNLNISVVANDSDGAIQLVEVFQGSTLIGSATTASYTALWQNVPAGTHTITAKATDNLGASRTSAAVNVTATAVTTTPTNSTPVSTNGKTQMFFIGDSITNGDLSSANMGYAYQTQTRLNNSNFSYTVKGYPSQSARWFINNQLSNLIALFDKVNYSDIIVSVFFGANDINSMPVSQFITDITELHTKLHQAGARTIIIPVMNRTHPSDSLSFNADRTSTNQQMYANLANLASAYVHLENQPNVFAESAPSNTKYFADQVHPVDAGSRVIAEEVAYTIATLKGLTLSPAYVSNYGGGTVTTPTTPTTPQAFNPSATSPNTVELVQYGNLYNTTFNNSILTSTNTWGGTQSFGWIGGATGNKVINTTSGSGEKGRVIYLNQAKQDSILTGLSESPYVINEQSTVDNAYNTIRYALYWNNSLYRVFEYGTAKFEAALPAATNNFQVIVSESAVVYMVNGTAVYTSSLVPSFPLYHTSALSGIPGTVFKSHIDNASISGVNLSVASSVTVTASAGPTSNKVVWSKLINSTFDSNQFVLTNTNSQVGWKSGATGTLLADTTSGTGEKARLRLPLATPIDAVTTGFSDVAFSLNGANDSYNSIRYALYWDSKVFRVLEYGVNKFEGNFGAVSADFQIVVYDDKVQYLLTGQVFYTSTLAPVFPLFAAAALNNDTSSTTGVSHLDSATLTGVNLKSSGY